MKGKKHTPEQIIGKLREAEADLNGGQTIGQVVQKLGINAHGLSPVSAERRHSHARSLPEQR